MSVVSASPAIEIEPENAESASPGAAVVPSPEFLRLVSHEFARRHLILSIGCVDNVEQLLISAQTRPAPAFNVGVLLRRPIKTTVAPAEVIAAAVDRAYLRPRSGTEQVLAPSGLNDSMVVVDGSLDVEADLKAAVRDAESDLLNVQGKAPAVRLVDLILFEALQRSASDVHVQPVRGRTLVRYRLDGVLHTVRELPLSIAAAVVSRIKIMAALDVAEQRAPQDGRASVTLGGSAGSQRGRRVDLRISTLPSTYGERVVIRILARAPQLLSLTALGVTESMERRYLAQVSKTSGIVLSTGPTGSGKTTTLYATLAWVSAANAGQIARGCELNMMTVEDPVEYDLASAGLSISQTQLDPKKGLTFATGLRHILRQDPDVIMVGEIRDEETARIAVQASLTGHLVLSTLHTNDASSAVARLIDLGAEPFLVASSLSAVLAQRLVRKCHQACKGQGCPECLGTGYRGRTGVFELLCLDSELRELVGKRTSSTEIKVVAQRRGMITLREAGEVLAREGITNITEVARVIGAIEEVD
jgi:general secretion pathway protein E